MAENPKIALQVQPGVMTEETDRGSIGRYKASDKIRFRQLLPEKLGGWTVSSFGTTDGPLDPQETTYDTASAGYSSGASIIPVTGTLTCSDGDDVWLFGDSKTGGIGAITVSDALALQYRTTVEMSGVVTAAIGDALLIEYPNEFTGGVAISSGGTVGSQSLTLGTGVTTYLTETTVVTIDLLAGGTFTTTLAADIVNGAVVITLSEALPSLPAAGTPVEIWVQGSSILDTSNNVSYTFHVLTNAPAASTTVNFTPSLYFAANGLDIDITEYQVTNCDLDQVATSSLDITPVTTFTYAGGATFPAGSVILESQELIQDLYLGVARALHDWVDLEGNKWAAIGTNEKLYLVSGGDIFDITPIRDSGSLSGPFTTVDTSKTVTVADLNHGLSIGDYARYSGASLVGGLDMNGEFTVATVVDGNSYTVLSLTAATSSVTGGGTVAYEYDIPIGPSINTSTAGWGSGGYGQGAYGEGQAGSGVEKQSRIWSLDNFGEDLLASPNGGSLYHWDRTGGPTMRASVVPNAPNTMERMLISPEARHVIALGAGTGSQSSPGNPDKLFIRWASQSDFNDWVASSVNTAGDLRLDVGSEIVTAVQSRGNIIVWTDESLHALQFISGDLVFGLRHLGQSVAISGPNAGVDINGIVHFMATDDFLVYDGVLRVMDCEIRNQVFDDFNVAQSRAVFSAVNKLFTEVWFFYPSASSIANDRYAKYNYKDGVWDYGTVGRSAFHDSSAFLDKPYGAEGGLLYQHETGVDETNSRSKIVPMVTFLETWDMEIDGVGDYMAHISEMTPDFKTLVGSIDLTLSGRGYPQRARTTKGPFTVTSATEKVDLRFKTRQIAFRIASDALADDWRMGTWKSEVRPHGRRGA